MASPQARRRQRSVRLVVAAGLVSAAAVITLVAVLSGSHSFVTVAAVLAVVLGAAATRITHSELMQSRRDHAKDRAEQARAYHDLTVERSIEHASFCSAMETRLSTSEQVIIELEGAVTSTQRRAAEATRKLNAEARRADTAEAENVRLGKALEESEDRAAEAIVRVAELEQDVDVLRAEVAAWEMAPARRHA